MLKSSIPKCPLVPLLPWVAGMVLLLPAAAFASTEDDLQAIGQIANLISLQGVFSSIFVIAGAWVLLRLTHGFVARIGKRFGRYRLFLKKAETFFQFFMYISTALIVFFLSFNVDKTVLALIGGTVAVALRDFWQQWPKSLESDGRGLTIGLFPSFSAGEFEHMGEFEHVELAEKFS